MASIVVPGQVITAEGGFLRGHGTYIQESDDGGEPQLIACVAGVVERVNKLISVRPVKSRYIGEVGDLVVGRVTEVGGKRWKVDVGGHQDAILMLSSVNLPGGAQRKRTYEDQLQMRTFFKENDLISAEVQQIQQDGSIVLHTRSLKYGKLENGQLLRVPQVLVKRLKQHFITLAPPIGVDVVLGTNGRVWITRAMPAEWTGGTSEGADMDTNVLTSKAETLMQLRRLHAETPILRDERERICRVRNAVVTLQHAFALITPDAIAAVYARSVEAGMAAKDMLQAEALASLMPQLDN
eukprot:TRINITY_DN18456_c0_g1_i1.p1 TRINITY_DN18456_c0_g1~~TRINITY_DN18456_c0_g1_i1.p1  ORF type:complete len:296 (-),score=92.88 TRINITY_DN18456_c0_g1_i1:25-912(-)